MAQIKVTLKSGLKIEGEREEVRNILQSLGELPEEDGIHYNSESKGPVRIGSMESHHIRNAICKMYRGWTAELHKQPISAFLRLVREGPKGVTIEAMMEELVERNS